MTFVGVGILRSDARVRELIEARAFQIYQSRPSEEGGAENDWWQAEQEVIEFVARRVAPYKKVRAVEFLDAVPKSASGKILRRELRARALREV